MVICVVDNAEKIHVNNALKTLPTSTYCYDVKTAVKFCFTLD